MSERKVKCPYCRKFVLYSTENKSRPFCSERCQLMDLGQWASESYAIPGKDANPEDDVNKKQNNEDEEPERPPRHHLN